jgi:hypothetical protein
MTTATILGQENLIQLNKKMLKAMLIELISRNVTFNQGELDYYDRIFKKYGLKNI